MLDGWYIFELQFYRMYVQCYMCYIIIYIAFSNPAYDSNKEKMCAVSPLGHEAHRGMFDYVKEYIVSASSRISMNRIAFIRTFSKPSDESDLTAFGLTPQYIRALEAVRRAPSANNGQPWRMIVSNQNGRIHFFKQTFTKYYARLDIGIAMAHFEMSLQNEENADSPCDSVVGETFNKKVGSWKVLDRLTVLQETSCDHEVSLLSMFMPWKWSIKPTEYVVTWEPAVV